MHAEPCCCCSCPRDAVLPLLLPLPLPLPQPLLLPLPLLLLPHMHSSPLCRDARTAGASPDLAAALQGGAQGANGAAVC